MVTNTLMLETQQAYHDNVKYSFRNPWQQIKRSSLKGTNDMK